MNTNNIESKLSGLIDKVEKDCEGWSSMDGYDAGRLEGLEDALDIVRMAGDEKEEE